MSFKSILQELMTTSELVTQWQGKELFSTGLIEVREDFSENMVAVGTFVAPEKYRAVTMQKQEYGDICIVLRREERIQELEEAAQALQKRTAEDRKRFLEEWSDAFGPDDKPLPLTQEEIDRKEAHRKEAILQKRQAASRAAREGRDAKRREQDQLDEEKEDGNDAPAKKQK